MGKQYDDTNRFVLFWVTEKRNARGPDATGKMNIGGIALEISGWKNDTANAETIGGSIRLKGDKSPSNPKDTFELARVANKKNDKYPDWKGVASYGGDAIDLAGWDRKSGSGLEFVSGTVTKIEPAEEQQTTTDTNTDDQPF